MWQQKLSLISSFLFIAVGLFLLFSPEYYFPNFYHSSYFGVLALISSFLVFLPPILLSGKTARKTLLIKNLQVIIAFSLAINIAGELGLYQLYKFGFEYDKFAHFLVSMLFSFIMCEILKEWRKFSFKKTLFITLGTLFLAGILWEVFEAISDLLFKTEVWGVYGEHLIPDTCKDIVFNTLGVLAGILVFSLPKKN